MQSVLIYSLITVGWIGAEADIIDVTEKRIDQLRANNFTAIYPLT